jgi:enamine deaminase RidA (YjgF/YER057c/UK114 family)
MDRRTRIETDKAPASSGFRSNAMVAAGFVFTGGHIGAPISTPDNRLPLELTLEKQVGLCLKHTEQLILAGGGTLQGLVEMSAFLIPSAYKRRSDVTHLTTSYLGSVPPLLHVERVADVAMHGMLEMDGIALAGKTWSITEAVEILRPFGEGEGVVKSGPFVFLNGLSAPGENLSEQSENLLKEAARRLKRAGSDLSQLVKMTVYLAEFDPYPEFNEATKVAFAQFEPPTRSVLVAPEVTGKSLVRINMIALAGR